MVDKLVGMEEIPSIDSVGLSVNPIGSNVGLRVVTDEISLDGSKVALAPPECTLCGGVDGSEVGLLSGVPGLLVVVGSN